MKAWLQHILQSVQKILDTLSEYFYGLENMVSGQNLH